MWPQHYHQQNNIRIFGQSVKSDGNAGTYIPRCKILIGCAHDPYIWHIELGYILTTTQTIINYGQLRHYHCDGAEVGEEVLRIGS